MRKVQTWSESGNVDGDDWRQNQRRRGEQSSIAKINGGHANVAASKGRDSRWNGYRLSVDRFCIGRERSVADNFDKDRYVVGR